MTSIRLNAFKIIGAALGVAVLGGGVAQAQPDPAVRGKVLFMQCAACHNHAPGAPAKVGPNLWGVIGRKSGAVPGFRYSLAMAKANLTWNEATLDTWLAGPGKLVPGTTMMFAGQPNAADRKAVIAYLKSGKP